jgi:hypothetical protein
MKTEVGIKTLSKEKIDQIIEPKQALLRNFLL